MQLLNILALAAAVFAGSAAALDFSDAGKAEAGVVSGVSINDESRIYGGEEVPEEDLKNIPFTVSLRKTAEGTTYCGGTLVAPRYIVTAAHCVKNVTFASIGSRYPSGSVEGERILVSKAFVHPKYVKDTHVYDVAVLELEKPSTATTLKLYEPGMPEIEGKTAVVRGWGVTEKKVPAATLLQVNVKVISNAICNKSYNNRITAQMLCAGEGGDKDTCQGDSGGPLIAQNSLIGIVSWGGECGKAPGVYVRVTSVLDFIQEKIGGGSPTNDTKKPASEAAPATTTPAPAPTTAAPAPTTSAPAPTTTAPPATTPALTSATPSSSVPASTLKPATPTSPKPTVPSSPSGAAGDANSPAATKKCGVRL